MSENDARLFNEKYQAYLKRHGSMALPMSYEEWLEWRLETIKELVGRTALSSNPRDYIASNHELFTMLWGQHPADTRAPQNGGGE